MHFPFYVDFWSIIFFSGFCRLPMHNSVAPGGFATGSLGTSGLHKRVKFRFCYNKRLGLYLTHAYLGNCVTEYHSLWDIPSYSVVEVGRRFRGAFCFHHVPVYDGSTYAWNVCILLRDYTAL
jgi:hypothetical protein